MMIKIDKHKYSEQFVKYLCVQLKNDVLANVDIKKLKLIETPDNVPNAFEIVKCATSNIVYEELTNYWIITIDRNVKFNGVSLQTLCKYVNFGNMNTKGFPIFTDSMKYFGKNIDRYHKLWLMGG